MGPIVSRIPSATATREVLVLFARGLPHLRLSVTLQDEPGPDVRRYFANRAARQPVEVDTVHFVLPRRFRNPDFHRHNLAWGYTQSNVMPLCCKQVQAADHAGDWNR